MPSPFDRAPKPAGAAPPSPLATPAPPSLDHREQERRTWVARSFTSLIIFGLIILTVILWRRDRLMRVQFTDSLERYTQVLNAKLDKQRKDNWDHFLLPAEWDVSDIESKPRVSFDFFRHYDDTLRQFATSRSAPTLIAWSDQPVVMMLSPDGRPVAIYDKGRVHVEWLREREFNRCFDQQQNDLQTAIREAEQQPVVPR